ncbi:hypothetical protein SISSUDRAFT_887806 [Sistotremastrum suecicum HHB10207 ss-3]|uniref:Uncharacterized protein n=1 Tax=Sistotremastrum suecicum HHB10207 ss-3 TaxID=1314776 RepID=A0A166C5T9_9AGAM|nr:hypothetical protein SISSUDRAFT_887806 [Sistotremastrum suecicum HHB10207 ss-3]
MPERLPWNGGSEFTSAFRNSLLSLLIHSSASKSSQALTCTMLSNFIPHLNRIHLSDSGINEPLSSCDSRLVFFSRTPAALNILTASIHMRMPCATQRPGVHSAQGRQWKLPAGNYRKGVIIVVFMFIAGVRRVVGRLLTLCFLTGNFLDELELGRFGKS